MFSDKLAFIVFGLSVITVLILLLPTLVFRKRWISLLTLFVAFIGVSYTSLFMLLGRSRPTFELPFWTFDLDSSVTVVGGMIVGDTAYIMVNSGAEVSPKLLYVGDKRTVDQLKRAMDQRKKNTGGDDQWNFTMQVPRSGILQGEKSMEDRKSATFAVPPPLIPLPKDQAEAGRQLKGVDGQIKGI